MSADASAGPQLLYDILERIVGLAPDATLLLFCRVSRDLRFVAEQELYRVLDFQRDLTERAVGCLGTIEAAPRLGKHVRLLKVNGNLRSYPNRATPLNGLLVNALELMPHLRVLSIPHLDRVVASHPEVLDTITGMQKLTDLTVAWHPTLAPLLTGMRPLRHLEFDAGSGLNNHFNNTALEHLLDVCAPTLEDLRLTGYGLAQYLLTRRTLTFPKCEELRLLFCDPLETSIAKAFPAVRRLEIFPNQVTPLNLVTDPNNFPFLELATLGVDVAGYTSQEEERKGRLLPHLAVFCAGEKITPEGLKSLLALLVPDKLLSIELPPTAKDTHVFMEQIFALCPSLQHINASMTVRDLPRLFSMITSAGPTTLQSVLLRCPLGDVISLDTVFDTIAPSLNALRARCPGLVAIEVRRADYVSTQANLQIRFAPWDRGELRWFKRTGRTLPPLPGVAGRL